MPINIPNGLPAKQILESEKIFALEEDVQIPITGGYRFYDGQQSCFQKHECRSSVEVL